VIELDQIKKHYTLNGKDVLILKGISLFIGQGEFVSIMGPSGSGKSTLSAILGCLSTPSSGTYKLNGFDVTQLKTNEVARLRNASIGFIFQDFNLLNGLTAWENVALPLVYAGVSYAKRRQRALACLEAVALSHKAQNRPYQLSGGQKQRVAIARALVNEPKFLFADEPTGALDKKTGHEILGIMQRLNMQGHTVIQVTHSPADAQYSKRILHLVDGNIVREETVEKPTIGAMGQVEVDEVSERVAKMWRVAQFAPVRGASDLESLMRLMNQSKTRDAKIAAARAVIRWGDFGSHAAIDNLFCDGDWVVRSEIVKNINLRPREEALVYFLRALSDENPWVRHLAMTELKEFEQGDLNADQQSQILKMFDDLDERVRASAAFIAGKWETPLKKDILHRAIKDRDNRVRANAVEGLTSRLLQEEFLPDLLQLAHGDRSNRVRANATLIVSKFDHDTAMKIAMTMMESQDIMMRSSAAWLFGAAKLQGGDDVLLRHMNLESEEIVLNQIVRALAKLARDRRLLRDQIEAILSATGV
jgi:putative ABC transport system ATP-binding protein